jgi:hypothetical protein
MRSVAIDLDIHKLIEAERRDFHEPANAVLRRLLKLPERPPSPVSAEPESDDQPGWTSDGVKLPNGTLLQMRYGRPQRRYDGVIKDGVWVVGRKTYDSPSAAASDLAITSSGEKTRLNGWKLWEVKRPDENRWTVLDDLRPKRDVGEFL